MKNIVPLDELEMFDVISAAYPERFKDESDETFDELFQFIEDEFGDFDSVSELLSRVIRLTSPLKSPLTGEIYQCLGTPTIVGQQIQMVAAVKREFKV